MSIPAASNAPSPVKKNGESHARASVLPRSCKDFYETLRTAVLCGQACAKDMGAIVFHGLWQGLAVLIASPQPSPPTHRRPEPPPTASAAVHDRQLVHMLANMVLAAETRGNHVY
ncbi:hypothetical protein RWE87_02830 [Sinorhizobium meliloti]|uniref:hypothetical protein n=1 Tax=Rhizobium meliloti TaxID=382 RepID=UPI001F3798E2|nr:hypothetical protein [Sinorhizobium meliloti]MCO6426264.1 hypothetical protein [Sinorhizobium meliloti]